MHDFPVLTEIEQQLLRAAAVHGLGPGTDLGRANSARIVDQVLLWRGLTAQQVRDGWRVTECDSAHEEVYNTLVRMIQQRQMDNSVLAPQQARAALIEGGGNWGVPDDPDKPPCWPQYNSCRLTPEGVRVAQHLLAVDP